MTHQHAMRMQLISFWYVAWHAGSYST